MTARLIRALRSWAVLVGLAAATAAGAPACGSGSTGSGGAGPGAGGGAGGGADCSTSEPVCGDAQSGCIACAEKHVCRSQLNACNASVQCGSYATCIEDCAQGDSACLADCANQYPVGSSAFQDLLQCVVCEQCPIACDAPGSGCAP